MIRNPDLLEKVQELKGLLISSSRGQARSPEENARYQEIWKELIQQPEIKSLLPGWLREYRGLGEFWAFIKSKSPSCAGRQEFLRTEFDPALGALEGLSQLSDPRFFEAGSDYDAFVEIRNVVKTTTREILVVDPWVDETLWPLLGNVPEGTTIKVLSNKMKGDFLVKATKFSRQHNSSVDVRKSTSFHDRFIVTDRSRCWHLGASIKDAGAKAFLMSEVQSQEVLTATLSAIEAEWLHSPICK
jgi:hypothetical protein